MSARRESWTVKAAVPLLFLTLSAFLAVSAVVARSRADWNEDVARARRAAARPPAPGLSAAEAARPVAPYTTYLRNVASEQTSSFINEVVSRMARDTALTASLIIPVIAGLGLNFGIVVGAMAGQIGLIFATNFGVGGATGLIVACLVAIPLSVLFGLLVAQLFNRAKGREMITGMIAGFFANGLYQLVFRFLAGPIIPIRNAQLMLEEGSGMRNTVGLGSLAQALDLFWRRHAVVHMALATPLIAYVAAPLVRARLAPLLPEPSRRLAVPLMGLAGAIVLDRAFRALAPEVPVSTFVAIGYLCCAVRFLLGTKLGQDCRAIGQDMHVSSVAGIRVDRVRTIAVAISTVLAAVGQIIFLQNMGTINTYNSHEQVGMFAVAALLIGGASVHNATLVHAIVGTFLFHTLFYVSPIAGREVLGNPQIGEYFRSFVAYGVIAMALAMHAARARNAARPD